MYVADSRRRSYLGAIPLINQGGGAYNTKGPSPAGVAVNVATALVPGAGIAKAVTGALFPNLFKPNKDPERLSTNALRYSTATAPTCSAEDQDFLWTMSKRKNPTQGWATTRAKDDAWAKYNAAITACGGVSPAVVAPVKPANPLLGALGDIGGGGVPVAALGLIALAFILRNR